MLLDSGTVRSLNTEIWSQGKTENVGVEISWRSVNRRGGIFRPKDQRMREEAGKDKLHPVFQNPSWWCTQYLKNLISILRSSKDGLWPITQEACEVRRSFTPFPQLKGWAGFEISGRNENASKKSFIWFSSATSSSTSLPLFFFSLSLQSNAC